jgi:alkylation response protein AidB-like acyl-CoA dehydrogenase
MLSANCHESVNYAFAVDFELTAEQREIRALAREVADAEIQPHAAAWDREHRFPTEVFAKLGELGLMGVCVPEAYGGAGADFLSYILVLEELSRADAGVGVTVAVHTSAVTLPILAFGTDEQKARFVPPLARGDHLGAFALTEPEAGSDAGALRTRAEPDGDGWTITGAKQWITNARHAGTFLVFARTRAETPGAVVKEMRASSPCCSASTRVTLWPAGASVFTAEASASGMRTENFPPSSNVR